MYRDTPCTGMQHVQGYNMYRDTTRIIKYNVSNNFLLILIFMFLELGENIPKTSIFGSF